MRKKAAIELSMNFLVVIILGIVVLSMGLYLAFTSMAKANQISDKIDRQTEQEIFDLLDTGAPVVVPLNTAELGRNKYTTFWVGIRNTEDYGSNFRLVVNGVDLESGCNSQLESNIKFNFFEEFEPGFYASKTIPIKENDKDTLGVYVRAGKSAKPCEYAINVRVMMCQKDDPECLEPNVPYDTMQKIYITVP